MEEKVAELVEAAKRGNDDAFYALMQLHKERLYRIAYSYLKNEQDSLEALQETTFRAYRSLRSLKEPNYFSTWLIRILLNYCADETARRKRPIEATVDGPQTGIGHEDRITLNAVIDRLDPRLRQVVVLKYYEDLTLTEVARVMECPEGTVKTWLHKALQSLRSQLGKEW